MDSHKTFHESLDLTQGQDSIRCFVGKVEGMATPSGLATPIGSNTHELPFQGTLSLWRHMPQWPETTQPLDLQVQCLNIGLHHGCGASRLADITPPPPNKKNRKWNEMDSQKNPRTFSKRLSFFTIIQYL